MPSSYSPLKIELMATGENSGTWGDITNINLGTALEEAIAGSADVAFSSANVTLTLTNTNASQAARNLRLNLTGTTGAPRDLIVPSIEKLYLVNNACADAVTVKNATGTGIAVPPGKSMFVYNNGTNVVDAVTHLSTVSAGSATVTGAVSAGSASLTTPLGVASGGTGAATLTANNVLLGNGTSAPLTVAPGTTGNVLTSNGTTWTSASAPSGGQYLGTATIKAIAYNAQTIGENITISSTQNGLSSGPITVNSGFTVTIDSGGNWAIV